MAEPASGRRLPLPWNEVGDVPKRIGGIRVVTWNIKRGVEAGLERLPDLGAVIEVCRKLDADFVAIQELDRVAFRTFFVDQAAVLARRTGMHAIYEPSVNWGMDRLNLWPGDRGHALFSRWKPRWHKVFSLSEAGPEYDPRRLILAGFRIKGTDLTVAATHLGRGRNRPEDQLQACVDELNQYVGLRLLIGDTNLNEAASLKVLARGSGLSLVDQTHRTFVTGHHAIDQVAHNGFTLRDTHVIDGRVSDHSAVVVDFDFDTITRPNGISLPELRI